MTTTSVLPTGCRVRLPDGRKGKLCWITKCGEAAVAVDGVPGTFHLRADCLVRLLERRIKKEAGR